MSSPDFDKRMLDLAARLALRGFGRVEPGPMVGAVIVQEHPDSGEPHLIGLGHYRGEGQIHAEAEALADCRARGEDPRGATLYCTLEPCNAQGRNPPCTAAVIAAGIARVVYARTDPNPAKAGGAAALRAAGITVELSQASPLATGVGAPFSKRITTGLPWVIAKWAQTLDGRIATRTGESKWISNEFSRSRVHRLRTRVDGILTGIGTVLADNPLLTARCQHPSSSKPAARIIADSDLDIPIDSQLIKTAHEIPTIIACLAELTTAEITRSKREQLTAAGATLLGIPPSPSGRGLDLQSLLAALLRDHAISTVMVEAGPGLLGSMFEADLIDEAIVYIAPMLLGDELARGVAAGRVVDTLRNARRLSLWRVKPLAGDIELTYRRARS